MTQPAPPPSDVGTEEVIIGSVLDGLAKYADLKDVLSTGDLYDPRHRLIWATIGAISAKEKVPSVPEVAAEMRAAGNLDAAGGSPYLLGLVNAPAVGDVRSLAVRVADLARKRRALAIIDDAAVHGRNGIQDVKSWLAGVAAQLTAVAGTEQPKEDRIRLLGPSDIFAQLPPIPWVIRGLDMCPGAPSLFAGYGYSGKSVVLQSMALQIAAGLPVWGSFAAVRGGCIHLDYEQGEHLTRLRYQRLAWASDIAPQDLEDRLQLLCFPPFYLDELESEKTLIELCSGKTLAIIDSFRAACRSTDENSSEARVPLDMLGRVSDRTGCAMAVIHHARKPSKDASVGARDAIRGSSALYDACASVFVLEGEPDQPERTMHHCKARVSGKTQDPMSLRIEDAGDPGADGSAAGLRVTASKAPTADERQKTFVRSRDEKTKEELREMFRKQRHQTSVEAMAASICRAVATTRHGLRLLVATGEVIETGTTKTRGYDYVGQ
ncbi:MAG TPA: AAA family ATPase [Polyangiaceae bacterium]|nr:AAA family ATPase [Polyangiaceae bacterium]